MNKNELLFHSLGEPFAEGLFAHPERSLFYRYCEGYARWFSAIAPVRYESGERLYPGSDRYFGRMGEYAVRPHYVKAYEVDFDALGQKSAEAAAVMQSFYDDSHFPAGWTHCAINYPRIVKEGLDSYRARIENSPGDADFREGLLLLLDGMKNLLDRSLCYLRTTDAPEELISALEQVPFRPARTYYEGLAAWNILYYYDGCDNLGIPDAGLIDLYRGEDMTPVIAELFENLNATGMWSCTVGHTVNPITYQCVRAIKGKRRPMLELMVKDDTPDDLFVLASENLTDGCTNPSFYNKRGIRDMLKTRFPQMTEDELALFCGCGCTETNLEGITRAGGTDADLNLLKIFEDYLYAHLGTDKCFDDFYEGLCKETERRTAEMLDEIDARYAYIAEKVPHPVRTLFVDDCIDKGIDYHAGGARYTWTMNSDSGIINVIDALAAVKKLYYDEKRFRADEFLSLLKAEDPVFFALLATCPCYGVDDEETDALGAKYVRRVYDCYHVKPKTAYIDAYTLTEHQFSRYEWAGRMCGPTPDGRHAGQPTCDSISALRGKASKGPTAMLRSCAKLPQNLAEGIAVCNLTLRREVAAHPRFLRALVDGYFALGGIQLQITVTSPEELKDALLHPDDHRDLIVRVGGYSEYFCRLSPALREAVAARDVLS